MKKRVLIRRIAVAAAVVAIVAVILPFTFPANVRAESRKIMDEAIEKMNDIDNYVVRFKVRTHSWENFDFIDAESEFLPTTFKRSFREPFQWKITRPAGRTAMFDGDSLYMWMHTMKMGFKYGPSSQQGVLEESAKLLNPMQLLCNELAALADNSAKATVETIGEEIIMVVESGAKGNFKNSYSLNSSVDESNSRRTYVFDKATRRLKSFSTDILYKGKYVTIIQSEEIAYDQPIDWKSELERPALMWRDRDADPVNPQLSGITSDRAVTLILESLQKSDIAPVKEAFVVYEPDYIENELFGLKLISVGKPFKSGKYAGEFVPCKVRYKNGEVNEFNMALRNDNRNGVWIIDGGSL